MQELLMDVTTEGLLRKDEVLREELREDTSEEAIMQSVLKENLMEYEEFVDYLERKMKLIYHDSYEVIRETILKNNEINLDSIIVRKNGCNVAPNIYCNHLYTQYESGISLEEIIENMKMSVENIPKDILVTGNTLANNNIFQDFQMIKDCVTFRVINYEKNRNLLAEMPHQRFLDLAITYHYLVNNNDEGIGTIRITNEHIAEWNIGLAELEEVAFTNTARIFPVFVRNMKEVICSIMNDLCEDQEEDFYIENIYPEEENRFEANAMVMTNNKGINGASAILYRGVLAELSKQRNTDFYILPSSIHEVILLPDTMDVNPKILISMVRDVNQTQVAQEEVLSNNIYFYSRENGLQLIDE